MEALAPRSLVVALGTLLLLLGPVGPEVCAANPLVVGHRGTGVSTPANPFPENTLPSLHQAFVEGADLVEVDVQLDSRGEAVLWHDPTLKVLGLPGKRTADLPREDYPPLRGSQGEVEVPSFRAALRLALAEAPGERVMDIELKLNHGELRQELVAEVARVLREEGAVERVLVCSFDLDALRAMERTLPGIESGLLVGHPAHGWRRLAGLQEDPAEPRIEWLLTSQRFAGTGLTPEDLVAEASAQGIRVGVWTVNRRYQLYRFWKAGVAMLVSDEPDLARSLLP